MTTLARKTPACAARSRSPGCNSLQFTNTPNTGTIFFGLDAFEHARAARQRDHGGLNAKFASIQEAFGFAIMPPPVLGLGTGSGFSLYVQDRAGLGGRAERCGELR